MKGTFDRVMRASELAERLNVSERTIYYKITRGELPPKSKNKRGESLGGWYASEIAGLYDFSDLKDLLE